MIDAEQELRKFDQYGDKNDPMTGQEKAELVWKEFIPPVVVGTVTLAAIISANHIGARRAAAIAAAFKISEQMAEEYKQKVVEKIGKTKEEQVRTALAEDRINRIDGRDVIIIEASECLFYDEFSGRLFKSDMETVKQAVNKVNFQVNNSYYASLSDFYNALGIPTTGQSDDVGWNSDELMEISFTPILTDNGRPAISMFYNKTPIRGFSRVH